jgi:hypothetical protein
MNRSYPKGINAESFGFAQESLIEAHMPFDRLSEREFKFHKAGSIALKDNASIVNQHRAYLSSDEALVC